MAKPSIFSREYKRRMRARKRRIGIVAVIAIAFSVLMGSSGYVKGWFQKGLTSVKSSQNDPKSFLTGKSNSKVVDNKKTDENKEVSSDNTVQEVKKIEEKFYEVKLQNDKTIKVVYEESNEGKKLKNIKDDNNTYYNLSPNGVNLVVWDSTSQTMTLVDKDGNSKDITKPFYKTKNTNSTITKEAQLNKRPSYIWCSTPKFISDDTIVYITNLPLLSKNTQFIWQYKIAEDEHTQIYSKGSANILFKDYNDNKLAVELDGDVKYILAEGKVVD